METNFFKQISAMGITGDLNITIKAGATEGNYIVSVLLNNKGCYRFYYTDVR